MLDLKKIDLSIFDERANKERCGVVVEHEATGAMLLVEVPNKSDTPRQTYVIDNKDVDHVREMMPDGKIVAVVHTHLPGSKRHPSYDDIKGLPTGYIGIMYHPLSGTVVQYDGTGVISHHIIK